MGLFNQILNALDNPNQQANPGQLNSILNTVQQLSNSTQANPSQMNSMLSLMGGFVRSALQEKQTTQGSQQAQAIVNQFGGTSANPQAVQALFSVPQIQSIIQTIAQRTGLDANMVASLLPVVVPLVLNMLKTGSQSTATPNSQGENSVLSAFLDADRDGDVDIFDAMRLAGNHLNRP